MARILADHVAKAFNEVCPSHWRARAYLKNRSSGVFNACKFTYKGGMIQLLMDCDAPLGQGFQVKFMNFTSSFGDYLVAIQKALYQVLTKLRDQDMYDDEIPEILSPSEIMFGLRKDGAVVYLIIFSLGEGVIALNTGGTTRELEYTDEESQVPPETDVDDLL